ncbi:hypothetical protein Tsubulata_050843 [Turnera subulata]|uniref:J domain-containing protein n=1 Tax=Turnera subulata TaxID=218843 RepID=A0A9Q0G777_9ROSI|nr:hypothetical protein Tsubulata_050843 [Turnera subulata]
MGSKSRKKHRDDDTPSGSDVSSSDGSSSSSSETSGETTRRRRRRSRKERRSSGDGSSRRRKREKRKERERERERERRRRKSSSSRKRRDYESESGTESESASGSDSEHEKPRIGPEDVVKGMLREFPNVGGDLKQLLDMIDGGQAVDIKGISERSLIKHLKKLFVALKLKEKGDRVFLLPQNARPTLEIVGPLIRSNIEPKEQRELDQSVVPPVSNGNLEMPDDDAPGPVKRVIGPAMPSAELLAAAAKLTEAQNELKDAELEEDTELFIGPPPPAMVAEVESANEAERFEEVTRIMEAEGDSPYDVVGVNHNMPADNIKKRYWKLSLLVHPDKCSHPQAHQAFIKLNKAFKDLQDPEKRKVLDEKIKLKEEQEAFKVELKAMREAAQWRRLQGISMEGDDELLAATEVKEAPKRDEWMTNLPPERKPGGVAMQSTRFGKSSKEGRGDTSVWTDTPSDRAEKAKMNYLEAYNEATALASNEEEKKRASADAELVDKYNKAKRSKSLVQKHQEETVNRSKKKSKKQQTEKEKEEWAGQHPWKPWDREKDLVAGRKSIKFDSDNMAQGLTSRFSSGNFQRNFL